MRNNYLLFFIIISAFSALSGCLEQNLEGASAGGIDLVSSSVTALSPTVTADGTTSSTIEIVVRNALGKTVPGVAVDLVSSRGGIDTVQTLSGLTNAKGIALFSAVSLIAGRSTFSAVLEDENRALTQTAQVDFTAGPVSADRSEIIAYPSSVSLSSGDTVTITVIAKDANDNEIYAGGQSVVFTRSSNAGESAGTISPNPGTDNGDGTYTAIYTPTASGTANTIGFEIAGTPGTIVTTVQVDP